MMHSPISIGHSRSKFDADSARGHNSSESSFSSLRECLGNPSKGSTAMIVLSLTRPCIVGNVSTIFTLVDCLASKPTVKSKS